MHYRKTGRGDVMLEANSFSFFLRFAMELAMEKGHSFVEELEKVSNVVSPQAGIFFLPQRPGSHNWICPVTIASSL